MSAGILKRAASIACAFGVIVAAPATASAESLSSSPNFGSSDSATAEFDGKPVTPEVAEALENWASSQGLNLEKEFEETPVTQAGESEENSNGTAFRHRGGIEPPAGYDYDPSKGSLNDYCTKSPDQFPAPGENADFSGACARHDVCYAQNQDPAARVDCNVQLNRDMVTICKNVYTTRLDPRRAGCISTAGVYFASVTAAHPSQWIPTIV